MTPFALPGMPRRGSVEIGFVNSVSPARSFAGFGPPWYIRRERKISA